MTYILDTNILIYLIRENKDIEAEIQTRDIFNSKNQINISIATVGELHSIALQNKWGSNKYRSLNHLVSQFKPMPIDTQDIVDIYANIDSFSKVKHPSIPVSVNRTSITMGKNDLWIAALTHILNATLLTTDSDFDHLDGVFFSVEKIIYP
jgi:tRNA(fMet)-specific endonuclease VapC